MLVTYKITSLVCAWIGATSSSTSCLATPDDQSRCSLTLPSANASLLESISHAAWTAVASTSTSGRVATGITARVRRSSTGPSTAKVASSPRPSGRKNFAWRLPGTPSACGHATRSGQCNTGGSPSRCSGPKGLPSPAEPLQFRGPPAVPRGPPARGPQPCGPPPRPREPQLPQPRKTPPPQPRGPTPLQPRGPTPPQPCGPLPPQSHVPQQVPHCTRW
mmetsp:Transcript_127041/g.353791  ORF Transcript_127041/g.353791 Transcript_127041/m.353791 type:complete len:219 (-) Transcript_127041:482-1138(-)